MNESKNRVILLNDDAIELTFAARVEVDWRLFLILGQYRLEMLIEKSQRLIGLRGKAQVVRSFLTDNGISADALKHFDAAASPALVFNGVRNDEK